MSTKHYEIQFGESPAQTVSETELAALKTRFGTRFADFTVSEVAAKPADITKQAAEAVEAKPEGKKAKAE
jgi:hypothetical protein